MQGLIIGTVARQGSLKATHGGNQILEGVAIKVDRKLGNTIKTTYVNLTVIGKSAEYLVSKLIPKANVMINSAIEIDKNQDGAPFPVSKVYSAEDVQILPMMLPNGIRVTGAGNVTRAAEVRSIPGKPRAVLNTSIAVNSKRNGQDHASFFEIAYFTPVKEGGGSAAENLAPYVGPKAILEVTGFLDVDKFQNSEHQDRQKVVITASSVNLLKGNGFSADGQGESHDYTAQMPENTIPEIDIDEDEIPF